MSRKEKFEVEIERKLIGDLFVTCMESGYSPWVHGAWLIDIDPDLQAAIGKTILAGYQKEEEAGHFVNKVDGTVVWYGQDSLWELTKDLTIELKYDREEDDEGAGRGKVHVRMADLLKGLSAMAQTGAYSLGMILNEDMDGPSADSWLQHVVFGKAVYG